MTDDTSTIPVSAIEAIQTLCRQEELIPTIEKYLSKEQHLRAYLVETSEAIVRGILESTDPGIAAEHPLFITRVLQELQEMFMRGLLIYREAFRIETCGPRSSARFTVQDLAQ